MRHAVRWRELVLALGAVPRVVPVPGLTEHGLSFKSLADAIESVSADEVVLAGG